MSRETVRWYLHMANGLPQIMALICGFGKVEMLT